MMSFYGCSATVKKLAPPKADLHPLKWLRVCKECLCIEWNAKGKTIVTFATSGESELGESSSTIQARAPEANVVDGKKFAGSVGEVELKVWADNDL